MFASNLDRYLLVYFHFGGDIPHGKRGRAILFACVRPSSDSWRSTRSPGSPAHRGRRRTVAITFALVLVGSLGKWALFNSRQPR
jgi:hypothetical protein